MKKLKYFLLTILLTVTGCLENDTMDNIEIQTTSYPIQYVTERLYGDHGTVKNIYPSGSNFDDSISDKLLEDYSSTSLFIFNGLDDKDNEYLSKMHSYNKKLKIINASSSIDKQDVYGLKSESAWLDPLNLLSMAWSIKVGFEEFTDSAYLLNDINTNYQVLRQDLIQLNADYHDTANRATKKTIVVSDDAFLFLTKYGIQVISLDEGNNGLDKNIYTVKDMLKNKEVSYIYTTEGKTVNDTVLSIQKENEVELVELHNLFSRTEEEYNQDADYLTLMRDNLERLKKQLYD